MTPMQLLRSLFGFAWGDDVYSDYQIVAIVFEQYTEAKAKLEALEKLSGTIPPN